MPRSETNGQFLGGRPNGAICGPLMVNTSAFGSAQLERAIVPLQAVLISRLPPRCLRLVHNAVAK